MKAILLASGRGERLTPVTNYLPKCLVPIRGKPLIDYWLDQLFKSGISRCLVNTHYMAKEVTEHIAMSPYSDLVDIVFEEELLGTGGTLLANYDYFANQNFFVAHADNLSIFDFSFFIKSFQDANQSGIHINMLTFDTDRPELCGIVKTNQDNIVIDYFEKLNPAPQGKANGAVYIMDSTVLNSIKVIKKTTIDISSDIIPCFIGSIKVIHNDIYHRDIGNVESFAMAQVEAQKLRCFKKFF